jgi:structural maintenance of chromosome 3 (chondroitin sulfate proteoglycan 6)
MMESFTKKMDRSISKKAELTALAAECAKNIRDLGVLPEEAFERFAKTDSKSVAKRLEKVNEALKKYKHVNKKAFEQYNNFTQQRETLTKRRKELDSSQGSIEELVQVLDQRKDEAIELTFKQVSKEFAQIFERLVPAGRGRLVIQRKTDQRNQDEESEDENRESVENYTGVGISVSFNSKHDEQQRIQQLSGGQKSKSIYSYFKGLLLTYLSQVSAPLHSSSQSSNATRRPSISSTKSTRILTHSIALLSRRCCRLYRHSSRVRRRAEER